MDKNTKHSSLLKFAVVAAIAIPLLAVVLFTCFILVLSFGNPISRFFPNKAQRTFINTCQRLEESKFNYESVSRLEGYISLEDKKGIPQMYSIKDINDEDIQRNIATSKQNSHKIIGYMNNNYNEGWVCILYPHINGTIISKPYYNLD